MWVSHICFIVQDTNNYSTSAYCKVSCPYRDRTTHVPVLGMKKYFKIYFINWFLYLKLGYALTSTTHKILHQSVAQLSLTFKSTIFRYNSNHQQPLFRVLVIKHYDQLLYFICVPTLIINIAQLRSGIAHRNHPYFHL